MTRPIDETPPQGQTPGETAPQTPPAAPRACARPDGSPSHWEAANLADQVAVRVRGLAMVLWLAQSNADALGFTEEENVILVHARGSLEALAADLERAALHFTHGDPGEVDLASGFEIVSLPPECAAAIVRDAGRPLAPEELEAALVRRFPGLSRDAAVMARCNAVGKGLRRIEGGALALAD